MAEKKSKKKNKVMVWLVSSAGTGHHYVTHKQMKNEKAAIPLKKRKYDPVAREHVLYTQQKIQYKSN